jgi:nucleoside phosphorylase/CheY-like chemotaxis protein
MISILIVDDNSEKVKALIKCLIEIPEIQKVDIITASDGNTGKKYLREKYFDLLILDLSLPERFGDDPEMNGGIKFLDEIELDEEVLLPFHIIGITAFSDLIAKFQNDFHNRLWHLIYFEPEYNEWSLKLNTHIRYLIKSKAELKDPSNVKYQYDLAIITALSQVELDNVLKLPANWEKFILKNDHTIYYKGIFSNGIKQLSVVAAASDQMGLTASTLLSQKLIHNFRPKILAMVGIAAGIKGKSNFGDIIISDLTWDYGSGKILTNSEGALAFKQDPRPIQLDPDLKALIKNDEMTQSFIPSIEQRWIDSNGTSIELKLKMICGPIASGSYVIENIKKIQEVNDQQRKLAAIDMETYGVFCAAFYSTSPKPKAISIKAICDFGDENKNDVYQKYAAFTSANYLYEFALHHF